MSVTERGYLTTSEEGTRTRVFSASGEYVDIDPAAILSTERLEDDESGLTTWMIAHSDLTAVHGRLDSGVLDQLFVTDGDEPLADVAVAPTKMVHCPPTVPLAVCKETRHGPCI